MKKLCALLLTLGLSLALLLPLASCGQGAAASLPRSYRDIPGVTQEEIAAIEALGETYEAFTYGHLNTTESFRQPDGDYAGLTVEVCALLTELFGIRFVPQPYEDWAVLKSDIDNCVTDFSGEFTLTAERAQIYHMTTPIAGRGLNAYTLTSAPEITTEADLDGLRVGFLGGDTIAGAVQNLYPESDFTVADVAGFSEAIAQLLTGEIDVFVTDDVSDSIFAPYDFIRSRSIFQFAYTPVSITTKNPDLQPVISVIDKYLDAGGMEVIFDLSEKGNRAYMKYKLSQSFTAEERAWLADLKAGGGSVNVALMHDAYPASFYNSNEARYDGAAYDILQQVSALTDIVFNSDCMPVEKPLSDILAKLKTGEISMMPQLLYSESRKDDYIWSDTSYITTNFAFLSKSDYPDLQPFQVYYATVGTVDKSVHEEVFQQAFPNHEKTIAYMNGNDAFDALESGEIDLLMLSETMLLVQTNYREKLGYKVNLTFNKTLDTLYGFNKDEVILRNIFDKTLDFIDVQGIEEDWLSRTYDYQSRLYRDSVPYIILFGALLLLAFVVVCVFYVKHRRLSKSLEQTVRQRTRELQAKSTMLSTIFHSIPDLVFCKDVGGRYTSCNPSFEQFAGCSEAALLGKTDAELFKIDKEMAASFIETDRTVLRQKAPETTEEQITFPDGTQKQMETIKTALVQSGVVVGLLGISRDITQRKEMEASLVVAKEQAEQNSRAKSDFLSRMSHEMRTPMNAIIGMTSIGKTAADIAQKDYCLEKIESASTHLLGVINDVLDISKIEAGKFELSHTSFHLRGMLTTITSVVQFRMEEKKQHFTLHLDDSVPPEIVSDEQRLSQVITNLLGNAIKFTPEGGDISLFVRLAERDGDRLTLQFAVKDTGIGISEAQQQKLFTSFEQGDGSISRKYGGTGLGLSISKHIVEMMGGRIWVESREGAGSSFLFTIQTQRGSGAAEPAPAAAEEDLLNLRFDGRRILLAEDVAINREILITLLEPTGIVFDSAENGDIAFRMFRDDPSYDMILMDIHMPEVDGYTATRMIRALPDPRAQSVPIVAMTANVFREDIEQCLAAGMNAHVGKPIDLEDVMEKLAQYLPRD